MDISERIKMISQREKDISAEATDKYMYTFSPISTEAKELFETRHKAFCEGAKWADNNPLPGEDEMIKELVGALEFYRSCHFEYCGLPENEPESASGEPANWLCGGPEGHEYQYESGAIAAEALTKYQAWLGEK